MNNLHKIPTYIINLKSRTDRKKHIIKEFEGRNEFAVNIIEACENKIGAIGLWNSITHIIHKADKQGLEYVLICEDDHQFTETYSKEFLYSRIEEVQTKNGDVLLGGVSWFEDALPILKNMYWVRMYTGNQFIIIFRNFYRVIMNANFTETDVADHMICSLTNKVYFIYPFISVQREFGYSDITPANKKKGFINDMFENSSACAKMLNDIKEVYKNRTTNDLENKSIENISIPTYIINLPERTERRAHIEKEFANKPEFDITIVKACKHKIGAIGLWLSIRKIIEMAIANEDEVIIICQDDHEFTKHYSQEYLLTNIREAHEQGADYINGGTSNFALSVPITQHRYWTNFCMATQFIIIYSKFFKQILDEPFDETTSSDILLSNLTMNKMILHPFISIQKDFGYSDVTPTQNKSDGYIKKMFTNTANRLETIKTAANRYKNSHLSIE